MTKSLRRSVLHTSILGLLIGGSLAACASAEPEESAVDDDLTAKNLTATAFGLLDKELSLTLDDGPGPRTVELAEWLAENNVPATFFMVGKNAKANPTARSRRTVA